MHFQNLADLFKPLDDKRNGDPVLVLDGGWFDSASKKVSGNNNAVYILPRALYTKMGQTFIYSLATVKIEVKEMTTSDKIIKAIWAKTSRVSFVGRRSKFMRK